MIVALDGTIVHLSEKVELGAEDDGAMSAFAEATFAAALTFLAISSF